MKKLEKSQMEKLIGGEDAYTYCQTLKMILSYNWQNMSYGALQGWQYGANYANCWSYSWF